MSKAIPYLIAAATVALAMAGMPWAAAAFSLTAGSAYGDYSRRKAKQEANKAYNDSLTDRTMTVRSAVSPRKLALGRVRLGGVLLYADTVGTNQTQFDAVLALCDGPIRRVCGLYVGDTYYPADQFDGSGRILSGQYSALRLVDRYEEVFYVGTSAKSSFTLSRDPLLSHDGVSLPLNVASRTGSARNGFGYTTLVATLSGRVVTLSAPVSDVEVLVWYSATAADPVLRAQWTTGAQSAASSWAGLSTPNWPSTAVCNGVAVVRTLMTWDETAYQAGAPEVNAVVDGACDVYDPRRNLIANPGFSGAVPGAPGTLPTGAGTITQAGVLRAVVGVGCAEAGPYIDIRWYGTASVTGNLAFYPVGSSVAPLATLGTTWSARVGVQVLNIATNHTSLRVEVCGFDSGGAAYAEGNSAGLNQTVSTLQVVTTTDSALLSSTVRCGLRVLMPVTSGQSYDTTLRFVLPQLWAGPVGDDATDPVGVTSNPALLAAWLHLRPRNRMGCGTPWTLIDWASVSAAANICEEQISVKKLDGSGNEYINRYSCHTVLSADTSPSDNVDTIVSAMAGDCVFTAGLYRVYAGAYRAPTITLTDDDVLAGHGLTIYPNITGLDPIPNGMTGTFADAAADYVETSAPAVVNDDYVASDDVAEDGDLRLHATTDARQANYLMGVALEQARPAFGAEITVGPSAANIALIDTLSLDLAGYEDFGAVVWEVRRRVNNFDGSYTLVLRETKANSWALDAERFTPLTQPSRPDTAFLWTVAPVAGLTVSLPAMDMGLDGAGTARFDVAWSTHAQAYVRSTGRIELRWRALGATDWAGATSVNGAQTSAFFGVPVAQDSRWEVQARAVNGVGSASAWNSKWVDAPALNGGLVIGRMGTLSASRSALSGNATASLSVLPTGFISMTQGYGGAGAVHPTDTVAWLANAAEGSTVGSTWYVRMTPVTGADPAGDATSSWLAVGSTGRQWTVSQSSTGRNVAQAELAFSLDGAGVVGAIPVSFRASISSVA